MKFLNSPGMKITVYYCDEKLLIIVMKNHNNIKLNYSDIGVITVQSG